MLCGASTRQVVRGFGVGRSGLPRSGRSRRDTASEFTSPAGGDALAAICGANSAGADESSVSAVDSGTGAAPSGVSSRSFFDQRSSSSRALRVSGWSEGA